MRESFSKKGEGNKEKEMYPRLVMDGGKLLTPAEHAKVLEERRALEEQRKRQDRRDFLKHVAAAGAAVVLPTGLVKYAENQEEEPAPPRKPRPYSEPEPETLIAEDTEASPDHEKDPTGMNVFAQLEHFESIVDMEAAVKAIQSEHFHELTQTPNGRNRIEEIVRRFSAYDIEALTAPFRERGLPEWVAIALPAQESDWSPRTSPSGAIGTHQFMPKTIRGMGYTEADALDPIKASEMCAVYLVDEMKRYGIDLHLRFSAYNAGANLNGFLKSQQDREKRKNRKIFHAFVAEKLMETYEQLKQEGFVFSDKPASVVHEIAPGDTMWSISKMYGVSIDRISEHNGIEDPAKIMAGARLEIPYKNRLIAELRVRNSSILEMLEYAPQLFAKQDALSELGYVAARDDFKRYDTRQQLAMKEN